MNTGLSRKQLVWAIAGALAMTLGAALHPGLVSAQEARPAKAAAYDDETAPAVARSAEEQARAQVYSPYAGRKYPTRVWWGDTHLHTANSADAFLSGNRMGPEDAYRFARGEEMTSTTGVPMKLSRPLDFLVVADHAEGLGVSAAHLKGIPAFDQDPTLVRWRKMMMAGGDEGRKAALEVMKAQATGTLPAPATDPAIVGPVIRSVWQAYAATADKYNEPGRFTAMIGFEWTSGPGGNNLHRNVLFRDNADRASQVMPFSSTQSENPEDLWKWMGRYEQKTGGQVLAIPHNSNLSNGQMFAITDVEGKPLTADYAARRARWEPLVEVIQTKGNSETHPTLSPNDEFSAYGIAGWDNGNKDLLGGPQKPEMRQYTYVRGALLNGLRLGQQLGTNPFKLGMVSGTDAHTTLSAINEDNYLGNGPSVEPGVGRWKKVTKEGEGVQRLGWQLNAAGYAAVWATENTRESLWDALRRKETYATSGTRMTVRFFGGWDFKPADVRAHDIAGAGYARGVPMGGDLPKAAGKAPTFLVAAMKDPQGANLDRVQIIKGWLDAKGQTHERVYDVAWGDADRRKPGKGGRLPPVGDTVDVATATWTNTIGDPDLATVWRDPDFNPAQPAFYYARVLEIPTPRWTDYDAVRFGIKMSPEVPLKHQERAWTSPIWYTP